VPLRQGVQLHHDNKDPDRQHSTPHPWQCGQAVLPGSPKPGPLSMSALQVGYGQYSRSSAGSPASAACQPGSF
jgi:hypothetical protein